MRATSRRCGVHFGDDGVLFGMPAAQSPNRGKLGLLVVVQHKRIEVNEALISHRDAEKSQQRTVWEDFRGASMI